VTRKGRRLILIGVALAVVGVAAGLALYALRDNIVFFYGPSELAQKNIEPGVRLRIGGLVKQGSLVKSEGDKASFVITDNAHDVAVTYQGALPDLFRKGRASSPKACSKRPTSSAPIRFSPSTTSATCRAKSSTP
jgi:cytochrome c-type biogenesis protein CcmE